LALRTHVHATDVYEDLVLLDVQADAYFCLPAAGAAWRDIRTKTPTARARELSDFLVSAALASNTRDKESIDPQPMRAVRRIEGRAEARLRFPDLLNLLCAWADLQFH